MNCAECTHYHDLGDKLMCDAGLMEVTKVGNPTVVVKMTQCEKFSVMHTSYGYEGCDKASIVGVKIVDENLDKLKVKLPIFHPHEISLVSDPMDETGLNMKIDRRTKEYKEKHKLE